MKSQKDAKVEIEAGKCSFFVSKKKRYCKMLVTKGRRFCGQHLIHEVLDSSLKRIPCPLDPKHTCFEHKLENHLSVCNAREKTGIPYQLKGINTGDITDEPAHISLKYMSDDELLKYLKKIQKLHEEHIKPIKQKIGNHTVFKEALARPDIGPSVVRHLKQNSSLMGVLEECGVLSSEEAKVFLEFGAGRGQLTGWLVEAVPNKEKETFLLIDKGAQRYKVDSKLKHWNNLKVKRIRIDIKDLNLENVEDVKEDSVIVACGKHLCGSATDYSLRCLANCTKGSVNGIVLALCCHHRCTWGAYTGKEFFKDVGLNAHDFPVLTALSSWAVSGSRLAVNKNEEYTDDNTSSEKKPEISNLNVEKKCDDVLRREILEVSTRSSHHANESRKKLALKFWEGDYKKLEIVVINRGSVAMATVT